MKKMTRILTLTVTLLLCISGIAPGLMPISALADETLPPIQQGDRVELVGMISRVKVGKVFVSRLGLDAPITFKYPTGSPIDRVETSYVDIQPVSNLNNKRVTVKGVAQLSSPDGIHSDIIITNATIQTHKMPKSISIPKKLRVDIGYGERLTATVKPADAFDRSVTWSTSNPNVATVDATGYVKPVGPGTCKITAKTVNGKKATCQVTVVVYADDMTLDQKTIILEKKGKTAKLTPIFTPSNATEKNVRWRSDNTKVATVSSSGKVTAKSNGFAIITAEVSGYGVTLSDSCMIYVGNSGYTPSGEGYLTNEDRTFTIDGKSVNTSMTLDQVRALFPDLEVDTWSDGKVSLYDEGHEFAIFDPQGKMLTINMMYMYSSFDNCATNRGVTLNSTREQVMAAYAGVKYSVSGFLDGSSLIKYHFSETNPDEMITFCFMGKKQKICWVDYEFRNPY